MRRLYFNMMLQHERHSGYIPRKDRHEKVYRGSVRSL
jgi:hypothetical protein